MCLHFVRRSYHLILPTFLIVLKLKFEIWHGLSTLLLEIKALTYYALKKLYQFYKIRVCKNVFTIEN